MAIIFDIHDLNTQAVDKLNGQFSTSAPESHKHDGTEGGGAKIPGSSISGGTVTANLVGNVVGNVTGNITGSSSTSTNVTTNINNYPIASIFEANGTTVKNATTSATSLNTLALEVRTTDPTTPSVGRIWLRSDLI